MDGDRKVAAAMAAVNRYLELESAEYPCLSEEFVRNPYRPNIWGVSGRQDQMQLRRMMQLKAFR